MKSGTCSGSRHAVLGADDLGRDLLGPVAAGALEEHADVLAGALEHVAVAREDQRPPTGRGLDLGERVQQVVGLEILGAGHDPPERLVELGRLAPLPLEGVGHRRAVGVVGGERLHAVLARLGAEAEDDGPRVVLLHAPQDLVDRAEQRVDRVAVVVGDRVGQSEEGAVEQRRGVADQQRLGHDV